MSFSIYEYTDYRCFLKDKIESEKQSNPKFSYRNFSRQNGMKSSSFLKLVAEGERNLGEEGVESIIQGFKLSERQAQYFRHLVRFAQAKSHKQKKEALEKIQGFRSNGKELTTAQYNIMSHWHYAAILELLKLKTKEVKDIDWISQQLRPRILKRELKETLKNLAKAGLVEQDKHGGFKSLFAKLKVPEGFASVAIKNLYQELCDLGKNALVQQSSAQREFASLTIAVDESRFQQAKEEIRLFRKRLHERLESSASKSAPQAVVQVNLQLFFVSESGFKQKV